MFPLREWGFDSPLGHHSRAESGMAAADVRPPEPPSFRALLWGSLRTAAAALVLAALAFGLWRGLVWLFPDVEWLRIPGGEKG